MLASRVHLSEQYSSFSCSGQNKGRYRGLWKMDTVPVYVSDPLFFRRKCSPRQHSTAVIPLLSTYPTAGHDAYEQATHTEVMYSWRMISPVFSNWWLLPAGCCHARNVACCCFTQCPNGTSLWKKAAAETEILLSPMGFEAKTQARELWLISSLQK